ncbi:hypothetical protein [Saccharopolyspora griseoalba]|uniref:Uncharacterized protein n=1 Tax=Saccharopolyspora griseoalba TaxID=1431848 RepID=A0ABW2LMQ0_9PSEU
MNVWRCRVMRRDSVHPTGERRAQGTRRESVRALRGELELDQRFEDEREGEAVKKLTPEAETPIFQEVNRELGELPEIDIHDFDQHAFEFLREYDEQKSQQKAPDTSVSADAEEAEDEETEEPVAAAAGAGSRRGGRRRKGN